MIKTKTNAVGTSAGQTSSFPVPIPVEKFRMAVLDVFLHYVRTIGWMTDEKTAWGVTCLPVSDKANSLFNVNIEAADLGITYDNIRKTEFARAMEYLYEFAFFGRLDVSAESMFDESTYTWISAIVCDAARGHLATEWESSGGHSTDSAYQCVHVAELANARNMLEGGESFFNGFWGGSFKERAVGYESLTIRQMSLLSGMQEMSIRAAANPKRVNPLQTHDEEGGTRIAFDVAKAWLQSKGRYIPITQYVAAGEIDLAKSRFTNSAAFIDALDTRREAISTRDGAEKLSGRLAKIGIPQENSAACTHWNISEHHLRDESLMRVLADILDLPAELLVLRTQEMLAIQQLSKIEQKLREATVATKKVNI